MAPVPDRIVMVGACAAGLAVAEAARTRGFEGEPTLIGDERHLPYDRPPLSEQALTGEWDVQQIALREEAEPQRLAVDLRWGDRAVGLDTTDGCTTPADGTQHAPWKENLPS